MNGQTIRYLRIAQHLTQVELAAKAGISLSLLAKLENNRKPLTLNSLIALARALKVPAWYLLWLLEADHGAKQQDLPKMLQEHKP